MRPQFDAALALAGQIKAHAPHCRVILTVNEMKRLGRAAAELTALADHLSAHGLILEMLTGPLPGLHDPAGSGAHAVRVPAIVPRPARVLDPIDPELAARTQGRPLDRLS